MADAKTYTQEEVDQIIAEKEALKGNRDEALTEAKKAKQRLKDYEGVDPQEYKTLKAAADETARKAALAEGNLEAWKKQVTDQHQKEREADAKRISKYESALGKRLRQDELLRALVGKAEPSMMELLVEHGSKFIHVKETDDGFDRYVGDERGNPLVADGQGTAMTIDQFVDTKLKAKFPSAFLGTGSSGGGATKSTGGASGPTKSIASTNSRDFLTNVADVAAGKTTVGS